MSLHAQMSPEAAAALAAQRRNSTIASVVIGLLVMTLLALLFWIIGIKIFSQTTEPIVSYADEAIPEDKIIQQKITNDVKKTPPASPSSASSPVITAATASPFSVPTPDVVVESQSVDFGASDGFGDGTGFGDGNGFGAGRGNGFAGIPTSMKKRCSPEERLARLNETGGNQACEDAVVKALRWMKKSQNDDGSWTKRNQAGMTGLAILAYLGHCDTPLSPEFGETVEDAIVYLIKVSVKNEGKLASDLLGHSYVYEHSIATYALAESYTFCNIIGYDIEGLESAVKRGAEILVKGQNSHGMWNYAIDPNKGGRDLSTSAWAMQALKATKSTGLKIPGLLAAGKKGLEGIARNQSSAGSYGYSGPNSHGGNSTLTGAGVLCHQQWGKGKTRQAKDGVKWISDNIKFEWGTPSAEIYGHYYYGQAMMEAGGKPWDEYNKVFRDETLKAQGADGSFSRPGGKAPGNKYNSNVHYATCLSTLMLEVYYRFLPGTSKKK